MKMIGGLTFHASHNYGSCLQAYALQTAILRLCSKNAVYRIINYRDPKQRLMYEVIYKKRDLKSLYLRLFISFKRKELLGKFTKFENFISTDLRTTEEISTTDELKGMLNAFDAVIVGSDQIWNLNAKDFSWNYFLAPLSENKHAISYATSMGCHRINVTDEDKKRIRTALSRFDYISVRDVNTKANIENAAPGLEAQIDCDPTLLLDEGDWKKLISTVNIKGISKKYILFYDLSRNKDNWRIAKDIGKKLNMPIYVTTVPYPRVASMLLSNQFVKRFDVGPKEWLYLLEHAELVLSTSFHGTIFSTIFEKPFFTINSETDNRISYFLEVLGLQQRNISTQDSSFNISCWDCITYHEVKKNIESLRYRSLKYLQTWIKMIETEEQL